MRFVVMITGREGLTTGCKEAEGHIPGATDSFMPSAETHIESEVVALGASLGNQASSPSRIPHNASMDEPGPEEERTLRKQSGRFAALVDDEA